MQIIKKIEKLFLKTKWSDNLQITSFIKILFFNTVKINKFIIYEMKVDSIDYKEQNISKNNDVSVEIIDSKQLDKRIRGDKNLPREFYIHQIHNIKTCALAYVGNNIAHISWIFVEGDKNRWFDLKQGEASINYSFTFPEYRGKGIFPIVIREISLWLKNNNFFRLLEAPHETTINTIKSFEKIPHLKKIGYINQFFIFRPKFKG